MTSPKRARRSPPDPLRTIPGVGPTIAADLRALGLSRVEELRGQDPQVLYERLCAHQGVQVDRCMLYVFRCAVYFAETLEEAREPERLKWWWWKDGDTLTRLA